MYVVSVPSYLTKDSLAFGSNSGNQAGHLGLGWWWDIMNSVVSGRLLFLNSVEFSLT